MAMITEVGSSAEGMAVAADTILAMMNPISIPISPPTVDKVADSIKNFKAAHARHNQVQDDQAYLRMHSQKLQCFPTASSGDYLEPGSF